MGVGYGIGMTAYMIAIILMIPMGILIQAALGHLVAKDRFVAAFQVREWWRIFKANWIGYLLTFLLLWGIGMVASFAIQFLAMTIVLCFLLPFAYSFFFAYVQLVSGALYALNYRDAIRKLAPPPAIEAA